MIDREHPPFVALSGIDRCGKGTQCGKAAAVLREAYGNCVTLWEPNDRDNHTGRLIRRYLEHDLQPAPPNEAFQRLFVIDRAVDTVCTVLPGLARGIPVVADRFALSTIAYGMLTGQAELFIRMHRDVLGPWLRWPDLTIILDIPAETAIERLPKKQGKRPDLFEKLESLQKIRQAYLELAAADRPWAPDMRVAVVDGTKPVDDVTADIREILAPYL